ncbi:MAG TPA: hypothetical protein VFS56_02305 [Gemmatimonadaceae bacterium]|nr:hypothetical protein [Gemmatimonadaceae bacterium]
MRNPRALPTFIAAIVLAGCASQPTNQVSAAGEKPSPTAARPLERLAGQEVLVLPVQYLAFHDSLGWQQAVRNRAAYLARLDTVIASTLTARGLGQAWTFGPEVARAARLNSIVMPDARALSAEWLRGRLLPDQTVREPLASQVRSLVGLKGSRYALLPVEMRFEGQGGTGVATLRLVMIDSRLAQVRWVGEIQSDPSRTFSPALAASVAARFADLVAEP